ncbi:hydrogenase maturation nickel metallochaperone HypA [Pontibacillus yanchengensis]|uniref:Hydrogenase maturation factor HypA n=1 Tax=Pontibacillus yanchengensis TaxID=462910 RepID=A0A6I5A6H6_9BACI|nr:hydrogenase maturation nickel metallochaperone HypA [Pontibacillus yanchengensis]MYL35832.1 hydrogenase maturation nickel metallochaperone HypA [Pontibacillus yanchengensis]
MHEMSLMSEIIKLVSDDAQSRGFEKIQNIEVVVGDLSNVLPDALELAFFYLRNKGFHLVDEQSELHILREEARAKCLSCYLEFEPDYRIALCPNCELPSCELISGETFKVESYEGGMTNES